MVSERAQTQAAGDHMTFDEKWPVLYRAVNPHYLAPPCYGAANEPESSKWLSTLCDAAGPAFRKGMIVLDYGCGAGRLANFISQRLVDFNYYGLEPAKAGPYQRNRMTNLDICRLNFSGDTRINFGAIGGPVETESLRKCSLIIAGSVFTHLAIEEYKSVIRKLTPAIQRGAVFVHTVFLGDEYGLFGGPKMHGIRGCHGRAIYTTVQIEEAMQGLSNQCLGQFTFTPSDTIAHWLMVTKRNGIQ